MIIYRAVNIYPGQIDNVLSCIEGIGSEYQIHLYKNHDGRDYMSLKVERAEDCDSNVDPQLCQKIKSEVKKQILVTAEVKITDYGSLPRSQKKSKRVFDNRD